MLTYLNATRTSAVSIAVMIVCIGQATPEAGHQTTAAAEDLVLGTWTLDVAKSTYNLGPAPKSQTRTYARHAQGIKTTIDAVDSLGVPRVVEFVAEYDSIQYPVTGSATVDGIVLKKANAHVAVATLSHAGRIMAVARRVVSPDGQTLTITVEQASGAISSVAVYTREAGS